MTTFSTAPDEQTRASRILDEALLFVGHVAAIAAVAGAGALLLPHFAGELAADPVGFGVSVLNAVFFGLAGSLAGLKEEFKTPCAFSVREEFSLDRQRVLMGLMLVFCALVGHFLWTLGWRFTPHAARASASLAAGASIVIVASAVAGLARQLVRWVRMGVERVRCALSKNPGSP